MAGSWWRKQRIVDIPTERLRAGHLVLVREDGDMVDLGACSEEDIVMLAVVAQEAYVRMGLRRRAGKVNAKTLGRVRELTRGFRLALAAATRRSD